MNKRYALSIFLLLVGCLFAWRNNMVADLLPFHTATAEPLVMILAILVSIISIVFAILSARSSTTKSPIIIAMTVVIILINLVSILVSAVPLFLGLMIAAALSGHNSY